MRFLADMGISHRTVSYLRGAGHEAVHLHEEGLDELPDSAILAKARQEGYILLTHDLDFGELLAASGNDAPTVITFRLTDMRPENVNRYLDVIIAQHADLLVVGVIISVTKSRIRVRRLPIK
jgi:predicted nuclease of predicted toxin-antitoxin system